MDQQNRLKGKVALHVHKKYMEGSKKCLNFTAKMKINFMAALTFIWT